MKKEIYGAAAKGDVGFLREARAKDVESATAAYSDTDLLGLTSHGNNIIHVAAQHGHHDFIEEALRSSEETLRRFQAADRRNLICGTNSDGDTPLHIAATQRTPVIAKQLIDLYRKLSFPEDDKAPWRTRNKDGNTPLHVALLNGGWSVRVAAYLLEIDHDLAAFTNNRNEAPLHLAVTYVHQGTDMLTIKMVNTLNCQRGALSSTNSHFVDENEDDSISLVRSLLENHSEIGCLCDADGMTPLLRAAFSSNLPVVDVIINNCPESIEVCDPKGKNVLHYIRFPTCLEAKEFLEKAEIPVLLINKQDHDGNTPMHIAVMNHDFGTVKAMVQHNANFSLKNKEGVSVQTLLDQFATNKLDVPTDQIQSKPNEFRALVEKENEKEVIKDELMSNDLYKAVCNGDWKTLREMLNDDKQFLSRLFDGSNIIHLAIQGLKTYEFSRRRVDCGCIEELIVVALKKYPILFCQTNHLGETPLHLELFHKYRFWTTQMYKTIKEELMELKGRGELPPWRLKDIQGNTILHTAIIHGNLEFAEYLIEIDANLAGELNHSKQTPLHLLCQQDNYASGYAKQLEAKLLVEKDVSTVYSQDVEGFTPLLRAAQSFVYTNIATEILKRHPQLIRQSGPQGRNFFHHLPDWYDPKIEEKDYQGNTRIRYFKKELLCEMVPQKEREILITQKDDQGNTPLDLAVEKDHFKKAQLLIECSGDLQGDLLLFWLKQHKTTTVHKICYNPNPRQFQEFLQSRDMRSIMPINRSVYDVSKEDIKEYMNTMGVVAALLATITFTAAFTVPGGYKGDTGIPNLGKKAAFQVFLVSDVVGMCSSMMVLFCLLWLLSKDVERDLVQFELVDMTIKLLLLSFYATLVAFMTGVYVTTISDTLWLAIFTCVLCSLLILLMRRRHIKIISFILRELPRHPSLCCQLPNIIKVFR